MFKKVFEKIKINRRIKRAQKVPLTGVLGLAKGNPHELPGLASDERQFIDQWKNIISDSWVDEMRALEKEVRSSGNSLLQCREKIVKFLDLAEAMSRVMALEPSRQLIFCENRRVLAHLEPIKKWNSRKEMAAFALQHIYAENFIRALLIRSWSSLVFLDTFENDWFYAYQYFTKQNGFLIKATLNKMAPEMEEFRGTVNFLLECEMDIRNRITSSPQGFNAMNLVAVENGGEDAG